MVLKAIETQYKGYHFRSRLEARWAVFFDTLGVRYDYEKEGYDLGGVWYLPDFYIPHLNCFIEIKGDTPSKEEEHKAHLLSIMGGRSVYIFFGGIPLPRDQYNLEPDSMSAYKFFPTPDTGCGYDAPYMWCECPACGVVGIEFDGRAGRLGCGHLGGKYYNVGSKRLVIAYTQARQARF